jgi:hypothetical protein
MIERSNTVRLPETSLSSTSLDLVYSQYSIHTFPVCLISHFLPLSLNQVEELDKAQNSTNLNGRYISSRIVLITFK